MSELGKLEILKISSKMKANLKEIQGWIKKQQIIILKIGKKNY